MTLIYALIPYTLSKCEIIYTYKFIIYLHVCQPHFCQKKFKKYIIFKEKNIKFFFSNIYFFVRNIRDIQKIIRNF